MRREEIFQKIENRKRELDISYEKDPGWDYLNQFVKNNQVKTLEAFLELDIWTCVKCLYYILSDNTYSIEEIDSMFDSFSSLFDSLSVVSLGAFLDFCEEFSSYEKTNDIIIYLENHIKIKEQLLLKKICEDDSLNSEILKKLKTIQDGLDEDLHNIHLVSLFQLLGENPKAFLDALDFYHIHVEMKQNSEAIHNHFEQLDVSKREQKNYFDSWFQEHYSIHQIIGIVHKISTYVRKVEKDVKKKESIRDAELRDLDVAVKMLERGLLKEEITNARDIVKHIKNLPLKRDVLLFIRDYNSEYYEPLEEEYQDLNENSRCHYQALLNDYGLLQDDYSIDSIMHNSIEEVRKILKTLEKFELSSESIHFVLENSSLITVLKIKEYIDKGFLSISFIRHHIELFDDSSLELPLFQKNIELLKEYSINPFLFQSSIFVLLEDTALLKHNLDICIQYDLIKNFRNIKDFHFLQEHNLEHKIDRLIELGYENVLDENLDYLNYNHMKRLEVYHTLGIVVESMEEMEQVLGNEKSFFIPEDLLDEYIPDILDYVSKKTITISMEEIENMMISPRTYQIGSVFVSKEKVNRLLGEGKDLYDAIFDGLKLSKDEYEEMISVLCNDNKKVL